MSTWTLFVRAKSTRPIDPHEALGPTTPLARVAFAPRTHVTGGSARQYSCEGKTRESRLFMSGLLGGHPRRFPLCGRCAVWWDYRCGIVSVSVNYVRKVYGNCLRLGPQLFRTGESAMMLWLPDLHIRVAPLTLAKRGASATQVSLSQ
jgi:hypothetical protein